MITYSISKHIHITLELFHVHGRLHQSSVSHVFPAVWSCEVNFSRFQEILFCFSLALCFLNRNFLQSTQFCRITGCGSGGCPPPPPPHPTIILERLKLPNKLYIVRKVIYQRVRIILNIGKIGLFGSSKKFPTLRT